MPCLQPQGSQQSELKRAETDRAYYPINGVPKFSTLANIYFGGTTTDFVVFLTRKTPPKKESWTIFRQIFTDFHFKQL